MTNRNVPKLRFPESTNQNKLSFTNYKFEKTTLKDILYSIIDFRGKTPKKLGLEWGGNIPALSAMNVKDGYIQFNEETHYGSEELYDAWMTHGDCKKNDIVMTLEAPMGNIAQIPDNNKYILSQRVILLKFNENIVLNSYMYQYLRSPYFKKEMNKYATGTTAKGIKQKNLIKIKLKIPPLKEQEKIASFLSSIDNKIELLKDKKEEYVEFKHYLLQNLFPRNDELTPKLRFEEFTEEWKSVQIKDIFSERNETNFDELALLSVTLNNGVIPRSEIDGKDNSINNKNNYKHVKPQDIVYNSMRMWQGANGVSTLEGIVSPAYTVLIPKKDICSDFYGYYFKINRMLNEFKKYSQGLTSDTWNLKYPLISQITIKTTSREEQEKIASFLSFVDKKIDLLYQEIEQVEEYKKGLLQKMFI